MVTPEAPPRALGSLSSSAWTAIQKLYEMRGYEPLWSGGRDAFVNSRLALEQIERAHSHGLDPGRYRTLVAEVHDPGPLPERTRTTQPLPRLISRSRALPSPTPTTWPTDNRAQGGRQGVYGVLEYYARVSSYVRWIDEVIGGNESVPAAAPTATEGRACRAHSR